MQPATSPLLHVQLVAPKTLVLLLPCEQLWYIKPLLGHFNV
jgi:hypothetical protein